MPDSAQVSLESALLRWKKMLMWKPALEDGAGSVSLGSHYSGFLDLENSLAPSAGQTATAG